MPANKNENPKRNKEIFKISNPLPAIKNIFIKLKHSKLRLNKPDMFIFSNKSKFFTKQYFSMFLPQDNMQIIFHVESNMIWTILTRV